VELHHVLEGPEDAPVLVMANSLGTTLEMWDDQAPTLGERFRLVRYDHRGHGGSSVPPGPYEIDDLGRDALAMLDGLGIERFSFCGLSMREGPRRDRACSRSFPRLPSWLLRGRSRNNAPIKSPVKGISYPVLAATRHALP
jgi:hypothetical protein